MIPNGSPRLHSLEFRVRDLAVLVPLLDLGEPGIISVGHLHTYSPRTVHRIFVLGEYCKAGEGNQ
jgi:hypothetical protein